MHHNINGTEFTTTFENNKYYFPTLYKRNSNGKVAFWKIYVSGDMYYREAGLLEGKIREFEPVKNEPKNVGRANATTAHEQALFKANSLWKLKKDELYNEDYPDESKNVERDYSEYIRPMLAQKFEENKDRVKYPVAVSPKLDGIRALIYMNAKGEIKMMSRLGNEIFNFEGIKNEAKLIINGNRSIILDGELYSHDIGFNVISGAVRSKDKSNEDKIKFYMFDLIDLKCQKQYEERIDDMVSIGDRNNFKFISFVLYVIADNLQDILDAHTKFVLDGYEGVMIRNLDGLYSLGKRSNNLLKYKVFEDSEFKIIDVVEGVGSEKGASIFVCETVNGQQFSVRPRGSIETRRVQFQNKSKYIGKLLTVRYQPLVGEDVLPRFPVGIDVRDYE